MTPTVVVASARSVVEATIWVDALRHAGIEAATFERGVGGALGGAALGGWAAYPVVVARGDIAPARNILSELAGAGVLAPIGDDREAGRRRGRIMVGAAAAITGFLALGALGRVLGG